MLPSCLASYVPRVIQSYRLSLGGKCLKQQQTVQHLNNPQLNFQLE